MNERSYETLLYKVTSSAVANIMELNGWSEDEAMERFAASKVYGLLEKEESKLWQYSGLMLATLFNDERAGDLTFPEV